MIMKKLNNRQNQVKSLDFNTNANLLFNCKSIPESNLLVNHGGSGQNVQPGQAQYQNVPQHRY